MHTLDNLLKELKKNFNISLTKKQEEIVGTTDVPLCVIAAPGSGKTLVYVIRIANLVLNHDINPKNILALTFSGASAKDMENRFLTLFQDKISESVHFSTIHSFSLKVVKEYERRKGIFFTVIEGNDHSVNKIKLLKDLYYKYNREYITEEKIEELSSAIGFLKNMMIKPEDKEELKNYQFDITNFHKIYKKYEEIKKENHYLDFDDMLTKAFDILKENDDILEYYRRKYTHIQLDEGQDTSKIQHEIVKLLVYPNNHIFLVGDDDQSIYQFRAAFPEELLNFDKNYKNAKILFMEENFRSSKDIVDLASTFIQNNRIRYKKKVFTSNKENNPASIIRLQDDKEQINYLVNQLKKTENLKETAILYRNNSSAISVAERLDRERISFYIRDFKKSFFSHWAILDMLAFLDVALDNTNMEAFSRIYARGLFVSKKMISFIKTLDETTSIFDRLIDYPAFTHDFQKKSMVQMKWNFLTLSKKPPKQALIFIEEDLGYKKYLQESLRETGTSYEGIEAVLSLLKQIAEHCTTIQHFKERLSYLETLLEESRFNKQKNAVVLSTIHSSKGLEWDNVFLIDLINGQFPNQPSIEKYKEGDPRELEGERRLFYVGMTRARKELKLLSISLKNNKKVEPSMFLKEIDRILRPNNVGSILSSLNQKKGTQIANKNKGVSSTNQTVSHKTSKEIVHEFRINGAVEHKEYGIGKVISLDSKDITVDFGKSKLKKFRIGVCIDKGILKVI